MSMTVPLYGFGGGGTSLNFDVKAYATEEALLAATPKENTIGIITTTPIQRWTFSAKEPEHPTDDNDGLVWIETGTASPVEFNVIKKNEIKVYPINVQQCVGREWRKVPSFIRRSEGWIGIAQELYIFKEGVGLSEGYAGNFTHPENGSGIYIKPEKIVWSSSTGTGNNFWITPQIDAARYSKLNVELACLTTFDDTRSVTIGVGEDVPSAILKPGDFIASVPGIAKSDRAIYEVKFENVDKLVYIKLAGYATTGEIYNIWLE